MRPTWSGTHNCSPQKIILLNSEPTCSTWTVSPDLKKRIRLLPFQSLGFIKRFRLLLQTRWWGCMTCILGGAQCAWRGLGGISGRMVFGLLYYLGLICH
ncbi:hypothetical protein BJY01DRAFT_207396 [Aspergillus pseudoustus]|uniref:Uncharacterized protein n=1 Tax=Aspergillus pseudoustus TaxID=1810923 RepID=A0ABR4KNU0_9EURO